MKEKRPRFFVVKAILDEQTGRYLIFHTTSAVMIKEIADRLNIDPIMARTFTWLPKSKPRRGKSQ